MAHKKTSPDNLPSAKDQLFRDRRQDVGSFEFDESVAKVFPDMLRRSIPGYSTLLHLIGVLANRTVQSGTNVYDLGCSLGAVSLSIRHAIGAREARIVALDKSEAMVQRCQEILTADSGLCPVEVVLGDISALRLSPCSLAVVNFTLQFAAPEIREDILKRIASALVPQGALVLSEKVINPAHDDEVFATELHDAFRESNGYTRMELSRKREALQDVLIPETIVAHEDRLRSVGLVPHRWFSCLNFVSWVATKP